MKIMKDTQQHLVLQKLSMSLFELLFLLSLCMIPIIVIPILIWDKFGVNTLHCQRLEPTRISCTAQKFDVLGQMLEHKVLDNLRGGEIVTDSDENHTLYTLVLLGSDTHVSFYESKEEAPLRKRLNTLQSFINDTGQTSLSLETAPKFISYGDIIIIAVFSLFSGIWVFLLGVLPVRHYLLSRNTIYHFAQTTRKLRIETYNRIRKLTENEISFKQIEKITLEEKNKLIIDEEDGNRVHTTWSLFLHLLNSEPLLIWQTSNKNEHSKISQIAQLMAKITDAEYEVSSDAAGDTIPSGKPDDTETQAKPARPAKKKFFVWLIILLIILFTSLNFGTLQRFFSDGQYLEFFTPDPVENVFSPWLSEEKYQRQFDRMVQKKYYPIQVEGRENNGVIEFRAMFTKWPPGEFYFYSWVGDSSKRYEVRDNELSAKGYRQVWHHDFTTSRSATLHQTVWIKQNAE